MMLKAKLLGQFDIQLHDAPIEVPTRSAQSLLAYLLLNAGTAHRRVKLAGLFWPDTIIFATRCGVSAKLLATTIS